MVVKFQAKFNTIGHDLLDEMSAYIYRRKIDLLYLTPNYERSWQPGTTVSHYDEDWEFCIQIKEDEKIILFLKYGDKINDWRECLI